MSEALRILSFRGRPGDFAALATPHLILGLAATWIVGVGRYWDNPRASTLQHLGVGSLIYVLALSTFLWLLGLPLRPERWSFFTVLTFVTLTAPPGLLYALPVERFLSPAAARGANLWFLAVVASWRVALYAQFLRRYAGLPRPLRVVQLLLPLTLVVTALSILNLERAVFDVMGGVRETTSADTAYAVLIALTLVSFTAFPVLLIFYLHFAARRRHPPET